ncbi:MAG: hypothetical protein ABI895_33680 [Deltaproteobacteria bacterium]
MNRHFKLKFAAGAGLAGAIALAAYSAAAPPPAAPSARRERSQHALEAQVAELERALARTQRLVVAEQRARLVQGGSPPASGAHTSDAPAPAPPAEPAPKQPAPPLPSIGEIRDLLDIRFTSEDDDRAWSRDAEVRAQAYLTGDALKPSRLQSVECRASLCRAEIEQPNEAAHRAYLEQTFTQPASDWTGPLMASLVEGPSGRLATVVFLARPGTELLSSEDQL